MKFDKTDYDRKSDRSQRLWTAKADPTQACEARLLEALLIEVSIPANQNTAGLHGGFRDYGIGGVSWHYVTNPFYIVTALFEKIADGIGHVDIC